MHAPRLYAQPTAIGFAILPWAVAIPVWLLVSWPYAVLSYFFTLAVLALWAIAAHDK